MVSSMSAHEDENGLVDSSNVAAAATNVDESRPVPYVVLVSKRFILLTFSLAVVVAYGIGCISKILLIHRLVGQQQLQQHPTLLSSRRPFRFSSLASESQNFPGKKGLPFPEMLEGKEIPRTSYSSRNFDTAASASSSSVLVRRSSNGNHNGAAGTTCQATSDEGECLSNPQHQHGGEEEVFLPAGQHLLVDMKGVDSAFLDSEERLANGILDVIRETRLTLLSYHCHSLEPMGVSCVGVLLESHISFHTWPQEGVITLDLFTCGSKPLVPVLPVIERVFGVTPDDADAAPTVLWSHKLRGFRPPDQPNPLHTFDLGRCILGSLDMDVKREVLSHETTYQRIDVYDVLWPHFGVEPELEHSVSNNDGSYQSIHPEFYEPDRVVLLDGILQSTYHGDASYHEALVHPAMFAHSNPKRVAIIGGGEGATLREVLKHNTVTKAIMVEIDQEMVDLSHEYLPTWSDCSDLVGSAKWCVNDTRTAAYYEDALKWFMDRYYSANQQQANSKKLDNAEPLDIIIVDALDPEDEVAFADVLYNTETFLNALFTGLDHDGILVMQLGAAPQSKEPPEMWSRFKTRAVLTKQLESVGFQSIHVYEEAHCGFRNSWNYLVAFKTSGTRKNWYANQAEIELAIRERAMRTRSGESPFRYFDGATMVSYQHPHKNVESVFCRRDGLPLSECQELIGFSMTRDNVDVESTYEVSEVNEGERNALVSKVDIQEGAYLGLEGSTQSLHFHPMTYDLISRLTEEGKPTDLDAVRRFMDDYGFLTQERGGPEVSAESTVLAFAKHATNNDRTSNVVDRMNPLLNPVRHRHISQFATSNRVFSRNISAGEEIVVSRPRR